MSSSLSARPSGSAVPPDWLASIVPRLPSLERAIVDRVRAEIPEYRQDPSGQIGADVRHAVRRSLRAFVTDPDGIGLTPTDAELFRQLGRMEAGAGREPGALQAALRIASDAVVQEILVWERVDAVPAGVVGQVSSSVARFVDRLARLAGEGYLQGEASRARRDDGARLVSILVRRGGAAGPAIRALAARAGWPVPARCAVAQVARRDTTDESAIDVLGEAVFGEPVLAGVVGGRQLIVTGLVPSSHVLRSRLDTFAPGVTLFLGPVLPLADAAISARLARRAAELPIAHTLNAGGVLSCDDHLLELSADASADATEAMVQRRLGPLLALSPRKRLQLASLLSAWLEFGGLKGDAPGVLDASRQTLSYRMQRLHLLLGDQLQDCDARVEMILALRRVLPQWRIEAQATRSSTDAAG